MAAATDHLRESGAALAGVFRNRSLRRLNLALIGSVVGDWAYAVALAVFAFGRDGAAAVGALAVVRYVSTALLAPVAAVLADRYDRRRVMVTADVVRGLLVTATAVLVVAGGPSLPVYALSVLTAWVGLAFRPAQLALLPGLATTPGELTAANATASTVFSVGIFVGPAIAGLLLAVADVGSVLFFDALTFAWSAVLVFGIHTDQGKGAGNGGVGPGAVDEADGGDGGRARVLDGYREILASRDLRLLAGLYVAQTVVAGASAVYEVSIALDLLDLGDGGLGVLNSALGAGGLVGGALALVLAQRGKLARDFGFGVALWAAPLLLVAAWPSLPAALVAMLLIGLGNSLCDVNAETIVQRLVPDEVLGRVFGAIDSSAIGGMAIGAALMPVLVATVGLRVGLVVVGVGVTAVVTLAQRGLRRIDRVALAPAGVASVRGVPMLAVLPEHTIERLARTSSVLDVPTGAVVVRQGEVGGRFYIVEAGAAEVTIDEVAVGTLVAGDSFGEIALLRDVPRVATVTATAPLRLRAIERSDFLPAVLGHAEASEQAELVVVRMMGS